MGKHNDTTLHALVVQFQSCDILKIDKSSSAECSANLQDHSEQQGTPGSTESSM